MSDKTNLIWNNRDDYPETDRDIIVKDSYGNEYDRHRWVGHAYYQYTYPDEDGIIDGYISDVDIAQWRYVDEM